jgi:predicted PurR-regulated permease PerM
MKDKGVTKTFVISLLFVFAILVFLYISRDVLAPFIISAFLAYLIAPIVKKMMLLGLQRWVAVAIVVILFCLIMIFTISVVVPIIIDDINVLIKKIPEYDLYLKTVWLKQKAYLDNIIPFLNKYSIIEKLTEKTAVFFTTEATKIPQYIIGIISTISIVCLVPIITFFMLLGYDQTTKSIVQLMPSKYVELTLSVFHQIDYILGGYIRGQIIEVCFIALSSTIVLFILGINYALLIGIVAGLCNLVPFLGPIIGFVLGVTVAGVQYHELIPMIEVAVAFLVIQQLDNNIVQPIVIGNSVNLSPVMIMFALLAGASAFGVIGMFLAVPTLALIKNVCIMMINRYKQIY